MLVINAKEKNYSREGGECVIWGVVVREWRGQGKPH